MTKRTLKILYLALLAFEFYLCYKWLIGPVSPVILALMRGTFEFNLTNNLALAINSIIRVMLQVITFSFVIIGTTKLYKHLYVSLPSDSDNTDTM